MSTGSGSRESETTTPTSKFIEGDLRLKITERLKVWEITTFKISAQFFKIMYGIVSDELFFFEVSCY